MMQIWWDDESAVSHSVSDGLTLYVGRESGKPTGVTIHRLHRLMARESLLARNDPNRIAEHEERLRRYLDADEGPTKP